MQIPPPGSFSHREFPEFRTHQCPSGTAPAPSPGVAGKEGKSHQIPPEFRELEPRIPTLPPHGTREGDPTEFPAGIPSLQRDSELLDPPYPFQDPLPQNSRQFPHSKGVLASWIPIFPSRTLLPKNSKEFSLFQRQIQPKIPANPRGIPGIPQGWRIPALTAFLSRKIFQMSLPKARESLGLLCWRQTSQHR